MEHVCKTAVDEPLSSPAYKSSVSESEMTIAEEAALSFAETACATPVSGLAI